MDPIQLSWQWIDRKPELPERCQREWNNNGIGRCHFGVSNVPSMAWGKGYQVLSCQMWRISDSKCNNCYWSVYLFHFFLFSSSIHPLGCHFHFSEYRGVPMFELLQYLTENICNPGRFTSMRPTWPYHKKVLKNWDVCGAIEVVKWVPHVLFYHDHSDSQLRKKVIQLTSSWTVIVWILLFLVHSCPSPSNTYLSQVNIYVSFWCKENLWWIHLGRNWSAL